MAKKYEVVEIPLKSIQVDENQPRKHFNITRMNQLRDSVKRFGVKVPIVVEKIGNGYLIEEGERRFRVATELDLETIPAIVEEPKSETDRLVQQFHIQDNSESWTQTEKAITVFRLSDKLGLTLKQVCDLLGIESRVAGRYMAFAEIIEKKSFERDDVGLQWSESIKNLKTLVKRLMVDVLEEDFTRDVEKKVEMGVINRIKSGEFKRTTDITRLKDTFVKQPKFILKFLNTNVTATSMFIESKAKGAYYLRNAYGNAMYFSSNVRKYLENPDVNPNPSQLSTFKEAKKLLTDIINLYQE